MPNELSHAQIHDIMEVLPHFYAAKPWQEYNATFVYASALPYVEITYWPQDGLWSAWNPDTETSAIPPDMEFHTAKALHDHLVSVAEAYVPPFHYPRPISK